MEQLEWMTASRISGKSGIRVTLRITRPKQKTLLVTGVVLGEFKR
jgi:ABC-type molybdate transport system permease subunit